MAGALGLAVGKSVTVHVNFGKLTDLELKQLMLIFWNPGHMCRYWKLDLTPEEVAAGAADVDVFALKEPFEKAWCQKGGRGMGSCSQEADNGAGRVRV